MSCLIWASFHEAHFAINCSNHSEISQFHYFCSISHKVYCRVGKERAKAPEYMSLVHIARSFFQVEDKKWWKIPEKLLGRHIYYLLTWMFIVIYTHFQLFLSSDVKATFCVWEKGGTAKTANASRNLDHHGPSSLCFWACKPPACFAAREEIVS